MIYKYLWQKNIGDWRNDQFCKICLHRNQYALKSRARSRAFGNKKGEVASILIQNGFPNWKI
jgi:hypothetical protein